MHVYIHVPFCARRCSYCDFSIAVRSVTPANDFVTAILAEWRGALAQPAMADATINTIYFGGGTPSRLPGESIARVLQQIAADRKLADDVEITIEANPDDITPELANGWVRAGVNRVSLGVQSHDPQVLVWMHRSHRAEQVAPAMATLRAAGIGNVSVDLIFALPESLQRDWEADVDRTIALQPDHISMYGLTVEPRTPLARWSERGAVVPVGEDRYAAEFLHAHDRLGQAGYVHYEVSNYARPGRRSRHNESYWSGRPYLGLGPSAHSFLNGERSWNIREWLRYLEASRAGLPLRDGSERLTEEQRAIERVYLGLRTVAGLPEAELPPELVSGWLGQGWATRDEGLVRLTAEGWLRLDALVSRVAVS
jgi:oxygen-independent coproporphyrinogen-3 oxidase